MKFSVALLPVAAVAITDASVRHLAAEDFAAIAGYNPESQVTDHCAIDRDQDAMEKQLKNSNPDSSVTPDSWVTARAIYNEGGNSKSYAHITITGGLMSPVSKGDQLIGASANGAQVRGKAYASYVVGVDVIKFQYSTSDDQASYVNCQVGALPTDSLNLVGCLNASGNLTIGGAVYQYTYTPTEDNNNGRTLAGFSTGAKGKMRTGCKGCPYDDFQYFYNYYGKDDYAHQMVEAAFDGRNTNFTNGNNNFSLYTNEGKEQIIKKGTAYMNVFMYVIREWEDALDDCVTGSLEENEGAVHAWDEGVCFYTGSKEVTNAGKGKLLHELADKRCSNYKTCGENSGLIEGVAKINHDLLRFFGLGQTYLQSGNCDMAKDTVKQIISKMYVPLIQGSMRYAYKVGMLGGGQKEAAEGAIFAAAVLPRVFNASPVAADTIHNNLKVSTDPQPDFVAVKEAFESVYANIGITCADVGGLWNKNENGYYPGMEPCVTGGGGGGGGKDTTGDGADNSSSGFLRSKSVAALSAAAALS